MSARRLNDLTILIVAGLLIVALAIVSFLLSYTDTSPRVAGSSYSSEPHGTRVAYLVLKELGHEIDRSFDPVTALRGEPRESTFLLANPAVGPSEQDTRAMRAFVERGGVVIAYGLSAAPFLPGVTPVKGGPAIDNDAHRLPVGIPGALTRGTDAMRARRQRAPELDAAYVAVYGESAAPALVVARFGEGRVIWSLDHTPIQNDGVAGEDNVRVLANAAGAPGLRTILWDEHYHGERRSLWSYLAGTPVAWGFAQLALLAVAGFAAVGRRRGPLRPRFVEPRTSPLEFVDTMGSLYERAGTRREAVDAARSRLRRRLAAAAGMPPSATDEQLVSAAAARTGIDGGRILAALSAAADLRRSVSDKDAVPLVAELQELTASVAAARTGRTSEGRRWR